MPRFYRRSSRKRRFTKFKRPIRVLRGKGDFWGDLWGGVKSFGRDLWGAVRPNALAAAGRGINRVLSGVGDYRGKLGSGRSLRYMSMVPMMHKASMGGIRIVHREMVNLNGYTDAGNVVKPPGPLYGSINWQANNTGEPYYINAGNSVLFPWLNKIALAFYQYAFSGLAFEYRPSSGDAIGQNPAVGAIFMGSVYDVYQDRPENEQQMASLQYVNTCKPSQAMIHGIECAKSSLQLKRFNVRSNVVPDFGVPNSGDQRMAYMAYMTIGVVGMPADGNPVGWVWATYDVKLYQPNANAVLAGQSFAADTAIFGSCGTIKNAVSPDLMLTYPQMCPFGLANPQSPPDFKFNRLGVVPIYGENLLADNLVNPAGVRAGVLNGFKFPEFLSPTELVLECRLTYAGANPCAGTGFHMGDFTAFGSFKFLNAPIKGAVFWGDIGNTTATTVTIAFYCVHTGSATGGFTVDGGATCIIPDNSDCTIEFTQVPLDWPLLAGATAVTTASF